jgi:SAM-dependent methyltransferase
VFAHEEATRAERQRTRRLFNRVAPCYGIIHRTLAPRYRLALQTLDLPRELEVLDVATGTGALAQAWAERGHTVVGIDFAEALLARARRRVPGARFLHLDLVELPRFAATSFGIVSMAYVLHGLPAELRHFALLQARRIASHYLVLFDYSRPGPWAVRLVESLEGPHYRSFVTTPVEAQLEAAGWSVRRTFAPVPFSGCWLCSPSSGEPSGG